MTDDITQFESEQGADMKTNIESRDINRNELQLATPTTTSLILDTGSMDKMMAMAEMMAQSVVQVPKHLQDKPSDCLAIIMQAMQWKMNPYVVAQKTHVVNGALGYEAQLVNAVLQNSGAVRGRPHYDYKGEGATLECRVGFVPAGESNIVWNEWLCLSDVKIQNSPLWKTNPKQQLGYLQIKNWARAYCPGAILGVYTVDEVEQFEPIERDITPQTKDDLDHYPEADFKKNLPTWTKMIQSGKTTADDIAKKVETKGRLSERQLSVLQSINPKEAAA